MRDILGDRYYWYSAKMHDELQRQSLIPFVDEDGVTDIPQVYLFDDGAIATLATRDDRNDFAMHDLFFVRKAKFLSARRVAATSVPVQPDA